MSKEPEIIALVERLTAVINTLSSAVEAIYETHPDPEALSIAFAKHSESDTARELATATDEAHAAGERLRRGLASILLRRLRDS